MKRIRRILLNVVTVLSLVLCVATVVLWVRSYWVTDTWTWFTLDSGAGRATEHRARSGRGWVELSTLTLTMAPGFYSNPDDMRRLTASQGLSHSTRRGDYGGPRLGRFPHGALVPPLAIFPFLCVWRRRADRRYAGTGLCPSCGYDLRATPDRCPECGTIAT